VREQVQGGRALFGEVKGEWHEGCSGEAVLWTGIDALVGV